MAKRFYHNGTIITMEEPLYAQALLEENGRICAVGREEEVRAAAGTDYEEIDLNGHTLMPSFIDPHSHFSGCAHATLQVALGDAKNFHDIETKIAEFIRVNQIPKGRWVVAQGYDHNNLQEKDSPRKDLLDRAAPENPVAMMHQSGHVGTLNSLALKELNITSKTPVPEGGVMEIVNGEVTGYMEETAFLACQERLPSPAPEDMMRAFQSAQQLYASYGITTLQEGMLVSQLGPLYQYLCAANQLRLDVVGYLDIEKADELRTQLSQSIGKYHNHFKVNGYKTFLDGSPQAKTAWMRTPYAGDANGYCGYPRTTDEDLAARIDRALDDEMQLLVHCNGDAACEQYLRVYKERLEARNKAGKPVPDIRPVMIHAQLLGKDQMPDMKKIHMMPSFFVAHVYHWGDIHIANFGRERASEISPAASAKENGLRFTFHQDAPVILPDMMETIWCAVNRRTKNGEVLGKEECISTLDALRAVTINAAYQYFEEESKGSLRKGKLADLVVLDRDPLKTEPMQLREVKVLETIKEGETVFKRS